jgi:hypothetical protein
MMDHGSVRALAAVFLIAMAVAARAAMPLGRAMGALRVAGAWPDAAGVIAGEAAGFVAGFAPGGRGKARDWRAIRARSLRRLRDWRLWPPDG